MGQLSSKRSIPMRRDHVWGAGRDRAPSSTITMLSPALTSSQDVSCNSWPVFNYQARSRCSAPSYRSSARLQHPLLCQFICLASFDVSSTKQRRLCGVDYKFKKRRSLLHPRESGNPRRCWSQLWKNHLRRPHCPPSLPNISIEHRLRVRSCLNLGCPCTLQALTGRMLTVVAQIFLSNAKRLVPDGLFHPPRSLLFAGPDPGYL